MGGTGVGSTGVRTVSRGIILPILLDLTDVALAQSVVIEDGYDDDIRSPGRY